MLTSGLDIEKMSPLDRMNLYDDEIRDCMNTVDITQLFLENTQSSKWDSNHEKLLSELLASVWAWLTDIKQAVDLNHQDLLNRIRKEKGLEPLKGKESKRAS